MRHARIQRWCGLMLLAGTIAVAPAAASEAGAAWIRGVYTGKSPRVIALPAATAWRTANNLSASDAQDLVVIGAGESMRPLYPPGTLLVLRTISYDELQPGQTAVYRSKSQRTVAHVLVARTRDGWRVAGLNNPTHDMEPVSADNLIGVVVAAYRPMPEPAKSRVAAR